MNDEKPEFLVCLPAKRSPTPPVLGAVKRVCSREECQQRVWVAPSGLKALAKFDLKIICQECVPDNAAVIRPSDMTREQVQEIVRTMVANGSVQTACRPLLANVPEGKQRPGWVLTKCPYCKCACWKTDLEPRKLPAGWIGACTECALRRGSHQREMDKKLAEEN